MPEINILCSLASIWRPRLHGEICFSATSPSQQTPCTLPEANFKHQRLLIFCGDERVNEEIGDDCSHASSCILRMKILRA